VEVGGIVEFMAEMLIEHWEEQNRATGDGAPKVRLRCSYASKFFFPKFSKWYARERELHLKYDPESECQRQCIFTISFVF